MRKPALWLLAAIGVAVLPVSGVFTASRLFHVRDLAWYFWPRHVWLRQMWAAGEWPWWDPYSGGGQSAAADALNQFFLLPVTLLRLLAPEVIGFNLWIALPFPLAAAGTWLWLRRSVAPGPAFVGASVLALSGPMLSTGNFPNLSWSAAFIPWVLWAAARLHEEPSGARFAWLAAGVALQATSGEPVTLAATAVIVVIEALVVPAAKDWRARTRRAARVAAATCAGLLLAGVQLVPLVHAALRSPRSQRTIDNMWSLHPLGALDMLFPQLFGDALRAAPTTFPWVPVLNSDREPLFYSLYLGVGAVMLALIRGTHDPERRARRFWWCVAAIATTFSFGQYTPIYTSLQKLVPAVASFRYPVKYTLFAAVAVAWLSAMGVEALRRYRANWEPLRLRAAFVGAASLAAFAFMLTGLNILLYQVALDWYSSVALWIGVRDAHEGGLWLSGPGTVTMARTGAIALFGGILLAALRLRQRVALAALLLGLVPLLDLFAVHRDLNPTADLAVVQRPLWLPAIDRSEGRVYVGGLMRVASASGMPSFCIDAAERTYPPAERPFAEAQAIVGTQFLMFPASWQVREILAYDLTELWPREYRGLLVQFLRQPFEDRVRLLGRLGVKYCVLPRPPRAGAAPLRSLAPLFDGFDLYDCGPAAPRVYVTADAAIEPDLKAQARRLFDAGHQPESTVLLTEAPPPAGSPGEPVERSGAVILADRPNEVIVRASISGDEGYLNLLDSYDPHWKVTVDGAPRPLLRANVLFRAVRLARGTHEVRFAYRPVPLYAGAVLTAGVSIVLLAFVIVDRRRRRSLAADRISAATAGFTLIELLIVIGVVGILFAIAVPWLLNARMAANEASAIASLRAITEAQAQFKELCGKGRYAANLTTLGRPLPTTGDVFLSPDLTSADVVLKGGYRIAMQADSGASVVKSCNDADTADTFVVTADPMRPGNSGRRHFATNADRVIYEHLESFEGKIAGSGAPSLGTELR